MTGTLQELAELYTATLQDYLADGGETALRQAYDLGRRSLTEGLGVLEITVLYHQALARALQRTSSAEESVKVIRSGESFFLESLAPFEMTHRGYRETNIALQDSDERYHELFDNANDIVFTTDLEGNITSLNRAGVQTTGYQPRVGATPTLAAIVAPEHRDQAGEMLAIVDTERRRTTYELEIVTKDGRRVPVEVSSWFLFRGETPVGLQGIARDITERRRVQEALRKLNQALEDECKRIAHSLHDEAGQLLASVHIALEDLVVQESQRGPVDKIKDLLYQIEEQIRRLSHELRPTILDDLGLKAALDFLTQGVSQRAGLRISVDFPQKSRLPAPIETALYRITQEALNNVGKHARAARVWIKVKVDTHVRYSLRDDGQGLDAGEVISRKGHGGLGLVGIRERLQALGGTLAIRSWPAQGTELLASIPLPPDEERAGADPHRSC